MTYIVYADLLFIINITTAAAIYILITIIDGLKIRIRHLFTSILITALLSTVLDIYFIDKIVIHHTLYACIYYFMLKKYLNIIERKKMYVIFIYLVAIAALWEFVLNFSDANIITEHVCGIFMLVVISYFIFRDNRGFEGSPGELYRVTIKLLSGKSNAYAYYDSGNCLMDPYNKAPVLILDYRLLKTLISEKAYDYVKAYHATGYFEYDNFFKYTGLRSYPIMYRTISSSASLMPAFPVDRISFDEGNFYENVTAAISRNKLNHNNDYTVLLNKEIKPYNREENSND